jgi:SAM-dependent methyltransferase
VAHFEQQQFCRRILEKYPEHFRNKRVLDIGSLDINGNNRFLFTDCEYTGLDVGEGPNVDIVSVGHLYDAPDESFDTIISTEVFEHDMFYEQTIKNIIRMLKPGGAFLFTCASEGRPEHGTRKSDGSYAAPLLIQISESWSDYYKNITEKDVRNISEFETTFKECLFEYNPNPGDLYFFGVKKAKTPKIAVSISTYTNSKEVLDMTKKSIRFLKENTDFKIICANHLIGDSELISLCDIYHYDKNNVLTTNTAFNRITWSSDGWEMVFYPDNMKNNQYHAPAVQQNIYSGVSLAKNCGVDYVICMNFDVVLSKEDLNKIYDIIDEIHRDGKNAFFLNHNRSSNSDNWLETAFFIINPSFFLERFKSINDENDYKNIFKESKSETNGLENIYYNIFKNDFGKCKLIDKSYIEFFSNAANDSNTQTKSFIVLPVYKNNQLTNQASVIMLSGKSIEENEVTFKVYESDSLIVTGDFKLGGSCWFISNSFEIKDNTKYNVVFNIHRYDSLEVKELMFESIDELLTFGKLNYL